MILFSFLVALMSAFIVGTYAERGKLPTSFDKFVFWGNLIGGLLNALEVAVWILVRNGT